MSRPSGLALSLLLVVAGRSAAAEANPRAIPTFEYWREGYPLVYDAREHQYRGSLVELQPDTEYEIQLKAGPERAEFRQRTLSEKLPIGQTTELPATVGATLTITEAGTEKAWHLVTPKPGAKSVSDVFNLSDVRGSAQRFSRAATVRERIRITSV